MESPQRWATRAGVAPKVMTSASESNSRPKSLSVPVMRAMRPSRLSTTRGDEDAARRPDEPAAQRQDDREEAEEDVADREDAGQEEGGPSPVAQQARLAVAHRLIAGRRRPAGCRDAAGVAAGFRRAIARHRRLADADAIALLDQDLVRSRDVEVDPRAELDHAHELAALHAIALVEVGDHPPRDQAGELAHADAIAVGAQEDVGVALVLVADVGAEGGELLAAQQGGEDDLAGHRAALHVHVEDREEGDDAAVGTRTDLRIDDLVDRGDESVGGRENDASPGRRTGGWDRGRTAVRGSSRAPPRSRPCGARSRAARRRSRPAAGRRPRPPWRNSCAAGRRAQRGWRPRVQTRT